MKDKNFKEDIFILYGKVLKGDKDALLEFKQIFDKYFGGKHLTGGHFTKRNIFILCTNG